MGSAFHQLCPRYSGTLTPTAPTAIRLWETFTFTNTVQHTEYDGGSLRNVLTVVSFENSPHCCSLGRNSCFWSRMINEILKFKGIHKVSQKVVPLYNGFMTLLCNYLCGMGYFL